MLTRRQMLGRLLTATGAFVASASVAKADGFFLGGGHNNRQSDFFLGGNGNNARTGGHNRTVQPTYTAPVPSKPMIPSRTVTYNGTAAIGSILVSTATYRLYFIQSADSAIEYPIGVGRDGMAIPGTSYTITAKRVHPEWRPTQRMRNEDPSLPAVVSPGPHNPLGTRALNLGDTLYRIHGTNDPDSIGSAASSGCIRMYNQHVEQMFEYVRMGAKVEIYNDGVVPGIHATPTATIGLKPRIGI